MENNKRHGLVWAILIFVLLFAIAIFWFISQDSSVLAPGEKTNDSSSEVYDISPANGYGVAAKVDEDLGQYLAGPNGMTLYITTKDSCSGECLQAWLPYIVTSSQENSGETLGTIKRGNGYQQTYNGAPLYYYRLDTEVGDIKGHGLGGEWLVARP